MAFIMKKRTIIAVWSIGNFLLLYVAIFGIRTTRVSSLQNSLNQSLKPGVSSEEVNYVLDAHGLEHSELKRIDYMSVYGHKYKDQLLILAIRRNTARALVWRESIQMVFVFEEDRHLARLDVIPIYDSF